MQTFGLEGILRSFALRNVDNAVDVEADFLSTCGPVLIAEAVGVFAIATGVKAVVARRDG